MTEEADSRGGEGAKFEWVSGARPSSISMEGEGDWRKGELVTLDLEERPARPADWRRFASRSKSRLRLSATVNGVSSSPELSSPAMITCSSLSSSPPTLRAPSEL